MSAPSSTTHEGEAATLRALTAAGLTLRLFSNDVVPGRNATRRSFVEASFPGYKPVALAPAAWTIEEGKGSTPSRATPTSAAFTRNADGPSCDVYGWYLTTREGAVVMAKRFQGAPWDLCRREDAARVTATLEF